MAQNANAGFVAWSYEKDLPLQQNKKELFMTKYKEYFMNNYLKQFTTNQIPTVQADAAVFDLEEGKLELEETGFSLRELQFQNIEFGRALVSDYGKFCYSVWVS